MKQSNTRLARRLLWISTIVFVLALCPVCTEGTFFNAGIWMVLLLPLGFMACVLMYATSQGLWFEMAIERTWKRVCIGIGFKSEARSYRNGVVGAYSGDTKIVTPKLRDVHGSYESWTGTVQFFDGQTVEEYTKKSASFALAFHVPFFTFEVADSGLIAVRAGKVPVPDAYSHTGRVQVQQVVPGRLPAQQVVNGSSTTARRLGRATTERRSGRANSSNVRIRGNTPRRDGAVVEAEIVTGDNLEPSHEVLENQFTQNVLQAADKVATENFRDRQQVTGVNDLYASVLVLLKAVPMARDMNGRVCFMPIEGQHWFVAARTGGGKGSWIWSLVLGLAPAWRVGLVKFWGCDPKRLELAIGREWWEHYADSEEDIVTMLEQCVQEMFERASNLQGKVRKFTPSLETPLNIIVVDEMGYLSSMLPDRKLRERAEKAVSTILALGRAVGYSLVGCVQDPRKETCGFRDLFPIRIAGGLPAPMVDLVLGEGMHDAGALCEQIPLGVAGAGVAYVMSETTLKPMCVRAAWCDDQAIQRALVEPVPKVVDASQGKDENLSGQLDWSGQPLDQFRYPVE